MQRYAGEWAAALRKMAALGAETMLPGHGLPIFGADRIRTALADTAELLESLEAQVLALMNAGRAARPRPARSRRCPAHLLAKPYLRPVYDHPQFILRNIWRLYGGWYDGEPDNLLPAPRAEQAREWVALAGGLDKVLARAAALTGRGQPPPRLPPRRVRRDRRAVVEGGARAFAPTSTPRARELEESSMSRNILNHAALASAQGKRDLAGQA